MAKGNTWMSNSGTCLADKIKEKLDLLGDTNTV